MFEAAVVAAIAAAHSASLDASRHQYDVNRFHGGDYSAYQNQIQAEADLANQQLTAGTQQLANQLAAHSHPNRPLQVPWAQQRYPKPEPKAIESSWRKRV